MNKNDPIIKQFDDALAEKNVVSLKSFVRTSVQVDPRCEGEKVRYMLQKLEDQFPEIFEEERLLSDEVRRTDPATWNREYYVWLLIWFEANFTKKRLPHIAEVGSKIYPSAEPKKQPAPPKAKTASHPTQAPKSRRLLPKVLLTLTGAAAIIIAVVLLIVRSAK